MASQIKVSPRIQRIIGKALDAQRREKRERAKRDRQDRAAAAKRLKNGLRYAKKIHKWAEDFRKSKKGKELMEVGHIPTIYNCVFFFNEFLEGKTPVVLGIGPEGLFWEHGMSRIPNYHHVGPEGLARDVDTDILKLACKWIQNGKAWKCIEKGFDYLKKEQPRH